MRSIPSCIEELLIPAVDYALYPRINVSARVLVVAGCQASITGPFRVSRKARRKRLVRSSEDPR